MWEENAGLASFCQALYPKLRSALLLQTNDDALADDLAQETVCRVIERWDTVAGMDSPEGWAFTVAFNLAPVLVASPCDPGGGPSSDWVRDTQHTTDPDHSLGPWVRDAIAQLPPRQRQVIVLRFFADLDVKETAEVMGCAEGTVKVALEQGPAGAGSTTRTRGRPAIARPPVGRPSRVRPFGSRPMTTDQELHDLLVRAGDGAQPLDTERLNQRLNQRQRHRTAGRAVGVIGSVALVVIGALGVLPFLQQDRVELRSPLAVTAVDPRSCGGV